MPQQVAIGQFDLAVTGRDWLFDHLVQFPSSPVEEVVDLGARRYGLAAVIVEGRAGRHSGSGRPGRTSARRRADPVASEYPNIADHFARAASSGATA